MRTFEIVQTESGEGLGLYEGGSEEAAILAMAADAGADTSEAGWDRGLVAREVVIKKPVTLGGWYETTDGRWAQVRWEAGHTRIDRVESEIPDRDAEADAEIRAFESRPRD